ncbi:hypothetical protein CS022_03070 [Veronia nyctiphanis]|uniref:Uncharacterized protein n=1 Tax=Veronia nyctiphanis TaxID=1278244 RepID=A0A4V1LTB0_9GAMM|nr:hypothetical protein [Veronia nyctiphanis]RXJ74568.1 hypothetical protein CS022_03070 [Veronia nyctiphanis]
MIREELFSNLYRHGFTLSDIAKQQSLLIRDVIKENIVKKYFLLLLMAVSSSVIAEIRPNLSLKH